jgi:two-component system OmpR family response regulator
VFAARSCRCGGLALCSGAVTVTLGRGELGVVCEAAVPVRPHNNEVDRIATAEGATRLDDILIIRTPKSGAATWIFHPRNKASVEPSIRRSAATSPKGRQASLEVSDVSREFPRVPVLKFSMSGRQDDTLRYKIGCHLPRQLSTLACMGNPDHILVVDDDLGLRELLDRYFVGNGYRVTTVANGRQMREVLANHRVDLIVLDLMLSGDDGLTLCRNLRANQPYDIPILMLTARGDEADRIVGLEMGADDYLTKPFAPRELLARIRSVLRRAEMLPRNLVASEKARLLRFGEWKLDTVGRFLVDADETVVSLSGAEYRLLRVFLDHPQHVLNRDQLLNLTQGREAEVFDRSIDLLVSRLRQRLREDAREPSYIKTVRSEGYVFAAAVEALPGPP